jgi:hypothetical protein
LNILTSTIDKPDCTQGSITGTAKIILIIHGITTIIGGSSGIRNVSWSASFISKQIYKQPIYEALADNYLKLSKPLILVLTNAGLASFQERQK